MEWNESEGAIKRTYSGFRKQSLGVVQFDTTKNRFLAAGDEFQIKFWDMNTTNMLTAVSADGGLPVSIPPPLCFLFYNYYFLIVSTLKSREIAYCSCKLTHCRQALD